MTADGARGLFSRSFFAASGVLLALSSACGTEALPPSGAGGTAGTAGMAGTGGNGASAATAAFVLTSPALESIPGCSVDTPKVCDVFPETNVSYGMNANLSPELHWTGVPAGTQSLALVLFDATFGQAHWALWNIPASAVGLAANVAQSTPTPPTPPGSRQANANFATTSEDGYFGPHVPCNVFELQLYALSLPQFSPKAPESAVLVSIELLDLGAPVLGVAKLTARSNDYLTPCE